MRRKLTTIYATLCLLLMVGGSVLVFGFAMSKGIEETIKSLIGLVYGFLFAPVFHELGHVAFARIAKMEEVYVKCFCFTFTKLQGKWKFGFISPFAPDQTQVIPKSGGNMQARAKLYTIGGLVFGGGLLFIIGIGLIVCSLLGATPFVLWGMLPYSAYLFFLNVLPLEYPLGKTDMLVYLGISKGEDAEKVMVSAMEIQGQLFAGKSYAEIDKELYFDLPQLRMDDPLYTVILDLRYRYFLEIENFERAGDCLNRMVQARGYLNEIEYEKLAAELTYLHTLRGDLESAEECGRECKNYLQSEEVGAKRILLTFSKTFGQEHAIEPLRKQAEEALEKEWILGVKKAEKILIDRI